MSEWLYHGWAGYELPALTNIAQSLSLPGAGADHGHYISPSLHMFLRQPKLQSITKYSGGGDNNLNSYLLARLFSSISQPSHYPSDSGHGTRVIDTTCPDTSHDIVHRVTAQTWSLCVTAFRILHSFVTRKKLLV